MSDARIVAILLAAGESTRMGGPKPLLPWAGKTLVEWQVEQLRAAGAGEIVVVLGSAAGEVEPVLAASGARAVLNAAFREGRASSVRAGAMAIEGMPDVILVLGVDQPRPAWVTRVLLARWREGRPALVIPRHDGKGGHPLVADGRLLAEMRDVEERTLGLRALVERHEQETRFVEVSNPCVIVDLNTPSEYESALRALEEGEWED